TMRRPSAASSTIGTTAGSCAALLDTYTVRTRRRPARSSSCTARRPSTCSPPTAESGFVIGSEPAPHRSLRCVFQHDATGSKLVAYAVRLRPVLALTRVVAARDERADLGVELFVVVEPPQPECAPQLPHRC